MASYVASPEVQAQMDELNRQKDEAEARFTNAKQVMTETQQRIHHLSICLDLLTARTALNCLGVDRVRIEDSNVLIDFSDEQETFYGAANRPASNNGIDKSTSD